MENPPFINVLPMKKMVVFKQYVSLAEGNSSNGLVEKARYLELVPGPGHRDLSCQENGIVAGIPTIIKDLCSVISIQVGILSILFRHPVSWHNLKLYYIG